MTLFWDALGTDVQGNANVELAELLKQLRESGGQACRWETPSSRISKEKRINLASSLLFKGADGEHQLPRPTLAPARSRSAGGSRVACGAPGAALACGG